MEELFKIEKMLSFCEKVCYFFVTNLLFLVSNIPVILFLLFAGTGQIRECLPLFLLSLVPMAPALSAVMYAMNRLIHGTETGALRDYKKGYASGFMQKAGLGAGQLFLIFMFWTNMEFFAIEVKILPLAVLSAALFAGAVLVTPNLYMLASRYEMSSLKTAKTAVVLLFAKPVLTLGSLAAFGIVLAAYEIAAGAAVLFMGSVYGFLVMFMNQGVMRELESR